MKLITGLVVFVLVLTSIAVAGDKKAQQKYDVLLQRIKANDQTVDFAEFRLAVADAGIQTDFDARGKLMEAAKKRDFKLMSEAADAVLKSNYGDLDGQYFAKIAAKELGDPKQAEFHNWVEIGLLKALLGTGNGKTAQTAMKVLTVEEEYFIIRIMRQQPRKQVLGTCAGSPCDINTTYDPETEKEQTWYFDVSIPMRRMAKALGETK